MTTPAMRTVQWPKERFFWAAVPGQSSIGAGVAPPGALLQVADEFPLELEALHVVVAPAEDQHLLVCAARRCDLAELDTDVLELSPASVPDGLPAPVSASALNVLVGEFLPRALRRQHLRRHSSAMLAVLGFSLLLSVGLERRDVAWGRAARAQTALAKRVEQEALGARVDSGGGGQLSLKQEVERLEAIAAAVTSKAQEPLNDPVATLAALCATWPTERAARPQGFTVSNESASLAVVVTGDPRGFLEAWRPPQGWRADEPRLGSSADLTRINLTLRPERSRSRP